MKLYSVLSIVLSFLCMLLTIWINVEIAHDYLSAVGKTRALFELKEVTKYSYKYSLLLIGIAAILVSILGKIKNEGITLFVISMVLALTSSILLFVRIWIFMV